MTQVPIIILKPEGGVELQSRRAADLHTPLDVDGALYRGTELRDAYGQVYWVYLLERRANRAA